MPRMNIPRMAITAVVATVADFVYGFAVYGNLLTSSFAAQSGIYRSAGSQMANMPLGALGILVAITAATMLFARGRARGVTAGVEFGCVLGIFVVGAFAVVNFATINMSPQHAALMAAAAFVEWLVVGAVIGALYRD
jgi:hypothetical protein